MYSISLKIIQIEKKMIVIICVYMYMKNIIRLLNIIISFVYKIGIYIIYVQ